MSNIAQTLNVYYTAAQYVPPTGQQTPALVDEKLIYPLIKDASQFQVGLVKAKVPLDTIPLTQSNIPFHAWQIELRQGSSSGSAYVEQLNTTTANIIWKSNGGVITKSQYSDTGVLTPLGSVDLSAYIPYISMFVVDDYENLYCIGGNGVNLPNTLFYVFSNATESPTVYISDNTYTDLQCITIDRNQVIYLASLNSGVQVFANTNSLTNVDLKLVTTILVDFNNNPLFNVSTVCSDQITIVGYNTNMIQVYDALYNPISSPIPLTEITHLGNQSAILHDENAFLLTGLNSEPFLYGTTLTAPHTLKNINTTLAISDGGEWNNGKQALMPIQEVGYGVAIDGYGVYSFPYSGGTGGVPYAYIAESLITSITSSPDTYCAYGNSLIASPLSSVLYTLDTQSNTQPLEAIIQTNFKVSPTVGIENFDFQTNTGLAFAVGQDNNLYKSNIPISPRVLFTAGGIDNLTNMVSVGVNFPMPTTTTAFNQVDYVANFAGIVVEYSLSDAQLAGVYTDANGVIHGCISGLGPEGILHLITGTISMPSQVFTVINSTVTVAAGLYAYGFYGGGDDGGTQWSAVAVGTEGNTTIVQILSGPTDTPVSQLTFPNAFCYIGAGINTGVSYLAVTQGSFMSIYTMTDPTTPTLTQPAFMPFAGPQQMFGVCFDGPNIWVSNSYGQASNPNQITSLVFNSTYSGLPTATVIVSNGNFATGHVFCRKAECNQLAILNFDNKTVSFYSETGTFLFNTVVTSGCNIFLTFLKNLTPMYSWTQVTITGADFTSCQCVAIDKNYTNIFYITDTATNKVFVGALTGNTLALTPYGVLTTTWQSVNSLPSIATTTLQTYSVSSQHPLKFTSLGEVSALGVTRNVVTGEFLVCTSASSANLSSYPALALTPANWTTSSVPGGCIFAKNGENIDAGPASIYTYQVLIDAINSAFRVAFVRANRNGAGFLTAPSVSMDFTTGLCTLNYNSDYVNSVNGLQTSTDGILFNSGLNNLLKFNSQPDTITPSMYLLYLSANAPASPYSVVQTNKSITAFNMLDKILFSSTTIYVSQSFFGNNQSNNVITDVDIDTTGLIENSGWLLYQPNFLRPFALASNNAIDRVQLYVQYSYIDGTTYPLLINAGSGWNAKLDFIRKYQF